MIWLYAYLAIGSFIGLIVTIADSGKTNPVTFVIAMTFFILLWPLVALGALMGNILLRRGG